MLGPTTLSPLFALIVEDREADFDLVARELRRSGFIGRCMRVETEQAYRTGLQDRPDIILADYVLPNFSALRALEWLQAEGSDIPLIVLTGVVNENVVVECMRQGAVDYLLKDRLTRLGPAVKRALEENEGRRQKHQTEIELRTSHERFQYLVETTKVVPWEYDLEAGRFTYVGPQAAKLLGLPQEEWYKPGFWEAQVQLEDREVLTRLCTDPLLRDREFICRMFTAAGETKHLHCVVSTLASDGRENTLRGFMMDITELKTTQISLALQAAELARSNSELRQFAYAASHDLQEPIRMVAFYTQLLAKRYQGRLDADADEFLGYALEGATRMGELVKQLLEFSRVSTRKLELSQVDSGTIFEQSLQALRLAVSESGAAVTHGPLPMVNADPSQLGRVFQNLLANAIKFRAGKSPAIHVSAEESPSDWHFLVRDNGIGVSAEYFETIFLLFQRLHTREEYQGSGVGLATCRRIIDQHQGRIWLESQPGAGSTFHFTLPKDHQHRS
jgi:PAS domain S-box-containing protein